MFKFLGLASSILCCTTLLQAQQLPLKHQAITFIREGDTLKLSEIGGLNTPIYNNIDLNNDGIEDLLIFDRSSDAILPLLHDGTPNSMNYSFAPEYIANFPQHAKFFLLAYDYDGDQIKDLVFTDSLTYNFSVAKGRYQDNKITFDVVAPALSYTNNRGETYDISCFITDLPTLADVDNDGDMDILFFNNSSVYFDYIIWFRNLSIEQGLGTTGLVFEQAHTCFAHISETGVNNRFYMSLDVNICPNDPQWTPIRTPRHLGSTLTAIDHDKNGIIDLVIGDIEYGHLTLVNLRQVGTELIGYAQDTLYPSNNISVNIMNMPAAYYVDVNNDGKLDLIAANFDNTSGLVDSTSWLYLNHAPSATAPLEMQLENKAFLYDKMMDFGKGAYPTFVDLNNDGLMDLVVSNTYNIDQQGNRSSTLHALLNVGNDSMPVFELLDNDFAQLSALQQERLIADFGDLNGDGAIDMIVGMSDGNHYIYINTAAIGQIPVYNAPEATILSNFHAQAGYTFSYSAPSLYDFDGDGDLDVVSGSQEANLFFFENTGNAHQYQFNNLPTDNAFGQVHFGTFMPYDVFSIPRAVATTQGTKIYIGFNSPRILEISNIDENLFGTFDVDYTDLYAGFNIGNSPTFGLDLADLNNDGILDIVIGNNRGGLNFFFSQDSSINIAEALSPLQKINIYPNPAKDYLQIDFEVAPKVGSLVQIYNLQGQLLHTENLVPMLKAQQIAIQHLPAGLYVLSLQDAQNLYSTKLHIQR